MSSEKIWFQDIKHFITLDNYYIFFPSSDMSFAAQLNSLQRFALYFCVVLYIIRQDANVFFILAFMSIFTFLLYSIDSKNKINEKLLMDKMNLQKDAYTGELCYKPKQNNPFMNVLISDYSQMPDRARACSLSDPAVRKEVKKMFDTNLYRDTSDIFHKNASDRQWVTNAITTIPNDQGTFAKWLYQTGPTCKDGNGEACYTNMYRKIQT